MNLQNSLKCSASRIMMVSYDVNINESHPVLLYELPFH